MRPIHLTTFLKLLGVFKELFKKKALGKTRKIESENAHLRRKSLDLKGENVEVQRPGVRMLSSNNRTPRQVEGGDGEGVRLL